MWRGNREAQRQADNAYAKLKPKKPKRLNKRQRRQEPTPVAFVPYHVYISSPAWAKRRRKFIEAAGGKCQRCGYRDTLHVHHKHYRTLGAERRKDVEVLCKFCHEHHHERDGVTLTDDLSSEFRSIIG